MTDSLFICQKISALDINNPVTFLWLQQNPFLPTVFGIIEELLLITDHNIVVNNKKMAWLTGAKLFMVISLIFNLLLLCTSVYDGLILQAK